MSVVASLFYYFLSRCALSPSLSFFLSVVVSAFSKLLSSCANTVRHYAIVGDRVTGLSNLHCAFNSINIQTSTNALSIIHVATTEEQQQRHGSGNNSMV
uniref:Putative secreted peptide n=1 Tax=Anopheles braziliensis TaxID=58242 RepID=A0A2M3ZWB2_9DIPT